MTDGRPTHRAPEVERVHQGRGGALARRQAQRSRSIESRFQRPSSALLIEGLVDPVRETATVGAVAPPASLSDQCCE